MANMAFLEPDVVIPFFHLRPDMHVADFGCGTGAYTLAMSRAVLPNGKVYAIDVQKELLIRLKNTAHEENIRNVEFLWADFENLGGSKLADHSIDFVLIANVLFQAQGGYKPALEIKRVLKPDGRVAVIDWSESFGNLGPSTEDVVTRANAKSTFESAGFTFEQDFPAGDHHYGLLFSKK